MKALAIGLALALALSAPVAAAPALQDFQGTFEDTVIQIVFVKVGAKVENMYVGDIPDSKHYMSVVEKFVAGQRVTFSVFARGGFRVSFWGAEAQLEVKRAEALDDPAGKGFRLTYDDGTVVEIVA